jgi:transcriptional regulator
MTVAHNNHAKAIEVLELRERGLNQTNEAQASEIADLRKAVNTLLTHLELTLEG